MKRPSATFVSIDKADQQRRATDACMKLLDDLKSFGNEPRFEHEVLRRITGDGQLWCNHQIGSRGGQSLVRFSDPGEVARQISDGWVDLGEPDLHLRPSYVRGSQRQVALFARIHH